jgi:hypothetical protein
MRLESPLLAVVLCSLLSGCTTVEGRWEEAEAAGSIEAYEEFLEAYPESDFADPARSRIEDLRYESARKECSVAAYEGFLAMYPSGRRSSEARYEIMRLKFEQVRQANKLAGYLRFINAYPDGDFSQGARDLARPLFRSYAEKKDTEQAYVAFLKRFPRGPDSVALSARLRAIRFARVKAANTLEAYDEFLRLYPTGDMATQVRDLARPLSRCRAESQDTVAGYEEFLRRHPDSTDDGWAKKRLALARKREQNQTMARQLAEAVCRMAPTATMSMSNFGFQGFNIHRSATYDEDLKTASTLLARGADQSLFRIKGYNPSGARNLGGATMYSSGSAGEVVTADSEGLTLLEFAQAAKLDEVAKLLQEHTSK